MLWTEQLLARARAQLLDELVESSREAAPRGLHMATTAKRSSDSFDVGFASRPKTDLKGVRPRLHNDRDDLRLSDSLQVGDTTVEFPQGNGAAIFERQKRPKKLTAMLGARIL